MELKIVNKTGFGKDTEIIVMDGNEEIGKLSSVRSVDFNLITETLVLADLSCYIKHIEILAIPKKETRAVLHHIHNKREVERLGLGRIN